ncbi:MAG TPA: adenylosuccinate lyase, partial [Firmicutes bacterium]|nr:adenylosuccinate lyase [Bacillota bacterium]
AMEAWDSGRSFRELLAGDRVIEERLGGEKLAACFDPAYYRRRVDYIYRRLGI